MRNRKIRKLETLIKLPKGKKFYKDGDDFVYLFKPLKFPLIYTGYPDSRVRSRVVPFPHFIVAQLEGQAYLMFLKKAVDVGDLVDAKLYCPPLPNVFEDGHICLGDDDYHTKIETLVKVIFTTIWDAEELGIENVPKDFPRGASPDTLYSYWAKQKHPERIKWRQLDGVENVNELMKYVRGDEDE